jgi:hypothetical protein
MGANDVLPVGRFSPARGIVVERVEKSIKINGVMELYGPEATGARATSIESAINTIWTAGFADGWVVSTRVQVKFRGPNSVAGNATQIEAVVMDRPSEVRRGSSGLYMTLNAKLPDSFSWTAAHEFGHILGLDDRYIESMFSKVKGSFGGTRTASAEPGYAGNLMADHGGTLTSQNLVDLSTETEPSPYWIHDDDYVASWMNTHPRGDLARLSTTSKLKAFQTLLSGWVSTDDLSAMTRICDSVSAKQEGDAIRKGVNLLDLTDLGQRTTLRLAMSKMP